MRDQTSVEVPSGKARLIPTSQGAPLGTPGK